MSTLNIKRRELLQMIRDKQVTPESGLALLKKFDESFVKDDIAVIGMSCRCAGAKNTEEFWQNIIEKKSLFYEKQTKEGAVFTCELPEKYCFDNEFFGISPKEALIMDPQQRVFLEESWKALENAGYTEERLKGADCGIFVGVSTGDYEKVISENGKAFAPETSTALSSSVLSSRLAYYLDLRGPAVAIDTACSSSATALHYALQSISNGDCSMAVAGGVAVLTSDDLLIRSRIISMTSPDGRCAAFDAKADGTVFADGVSCIVIKKLADAERDKDNIIAVIRGSAINNNGKTNGITAPSANSQSSLMRRLYTEKEIAPETIGYIETHGTGTPLGDPIEFKALSEVYANVEKGKCALGACKSTIGHTMAASGLFNVISVINSFEHGLIPPIAGFRKVNERIDLENSPFCIYTEPKEWAKGINRAAVSSFGFSGTNFHAVLESYPHRPAQERYKSGEYYFIPVSAKNEESLKLAVNQLLDFCEKCSDQMLPDMEYTLVEGRNQFPVRKCFTVSSIDMLKNCLKQALNGLKPEYCSELEQICTRFMNGEHIRISDIGAEHGGKIISMPSYCFARKKFTFSAETQDQQLQNIREMIGAVEACCVSYLVHFIDDAGVLRSGSVSVSDLRSLFGVIGKYDKLFSRIIRILATRDILSVDNDRVSVTDRYQAVLSEGDAEKKAEQTMEQYPDSRHQLTLLGMCFRDYAAVLSGKKTSIEVMFPDGDLSYVENIYQNDPVTDHYNVQLASCVAEIAKKTGRKISILEIGAGTGATTEAVLNCKELSGNISRYCYTDVSAKFLKYGKEKFASYPFMEQEMLDISSFPVPERFSGQFDVVIASNVLHATRDIAETLANAAILLKEGGTILINEVVRENIFSDLTFGLLDGWWNFEDTENRMEFSPVVSEQKWKENLERSGFSGFVPHCSDACVTYNMKQNVMSAVRRKNASRRQLSQDEIRSMVIRIIADKLMLQESDVDADAMFMDYGVDSITSVDIVKELNAKLSVELKATDFFRYGNISRLTEQLRGAEMVGDIAPADDEKVSSGFDAKCTECTDDDIAIVGISLRYAGADNADEYWDTILNARDNVREIERWDSDSYFDPDPDNKRRSYSKWSGMLDNIFSFDSKFFGILPREAELMDPEHRVFLEEAYHAFEDAGYTRQMLARRKCGVYIGNVGSCYETNIREADRNNDAYAFLGNIPSVLPARISYFLNLKGPAIAIDTACSSSLVAIHLAYQAIRSGEVEMALAGGISLLSNPDFFILTSRGNMLSPTGKCWAFDERADGFVPSEGIGLVVLKKLSAAKRDKDHIYGVIKGSGMNQDGKSNGITSPNVDAQSDLEKEVYRNFDIDVNRIGYVEAHGTGTKLGDPIEIEALTNTFSTFTAKKNYCALGSVKANIGHSMAAAGAASVIKSLLVMENKTIPPVCNFSSLNKYIDLENSSFYIPENARNWEAEPGSRLSVVSSFGISGTNVHMVLGEYDEQYRPAEAQKENLFVFSNANEKRLKEYLALFADWLEHHSEVDMGALAYTLAMRRNHFANRAAVVSTDRETLISKLRLLASGQTISGRCECEPGSSAELREAGEKFVRKEETDLSTVCPEYHNISIPGYEFNRRYYSVDPEKTDNSDEYILTRAEWRKIPQQRAFSGKQGVVVVWTDGQSELADKLGVSVCDSMVVKLHVNDINEQSVSKIAALMNDSVISVVDIADINCSSEPYRRLEMMQLLLNMRNRKNVRFLHLTLGSEPFKAGTRCNVNGAVMSAFAKMLKDEYHGIQSMTVDFASESAIAGGAAELLMKSWDHGKLCLRDGVLYEQAEVISNAPASSDKIREGIGGTVLITGAFGGIGRYITGRLLEMGYRKFALLSRSPVTDRTSERGKLLETLDKHKAEYLLYSGSLTDRQKLGRFVEQVKAELGDITGVFHLAGNSDDNTEYAFFKKDIGQMRSVLEPKTIGTDNVFELTDSLKLRYFVMFSSISAVYSKLACGICTYAAANEYLIHFAKAKAASGDDRVFALCWSDWNVNGIGKVDTPVFKNMGFKRLEPNKAFELLCRAVSAGSSPVQIASRRTGFAEASLTFREPEKTAAVPRNIPAAKVTASLPADLKNAMTEILSEELRIPAEEIDENERFNEMGVDSIVLGEIVKAMERRFETTIDPNILLEYPTLASVSEQLYQSGITVSKTGSDPEKTDTPAKAVPADVKKAMTGILSEELRIPAEEIDENERFNEMGVDSIVLGEIVKAMERRFETTIDPNILLEYPTLASVSEQLYKSGVTAGEANSQPAEHVAEEIQAVNAAEQITDRRVAVIGMAAHFPGAQSKEVFWDNLVSGIDSITEVPASRWDTERFYSPEGGIGKTNSKWGGFIQDIEMFDPEYFGFKKQDGVKFDPAIRQFLEVAAETFNDAGYTKKDVWGRKIAVFAGARTGSYTAMSGQFEKNTIIGTGQNFVAAHISHVYNLSGASMTVDSACSSSLSAVHLAYNSLLCGECEAALAGGVDILLNESPYLIMGASGALSPDGKCKTFDVSANGFVPGEGCGAVLLKRYADAVRDGDHIYAVINASAVNNDGNTMGVTTPNPEAQQKVICDAIEKSGISPENISYIETHGTGTLIGDPIELKSLTGVFRKYTDKKHYCAVGSVKTNIGHLLSASGIASFIKCCLVVSNRFVPPTLNCVNVNPRFRFDESPFYPALEGAVYGRGGEMTVGVSSFGFGGTNVHQIISSCSSSAEKKKLPPIEFHRERYWNDQLRNGAAASQEASLRRIFQVTPDSTTQKKRLFTVKRNEDE